LGACSRLNQSQFDQTLVNAVAVHSFPETIAKATVESAKQAEVKAIVVLSFTGAMASRIAKYRPAVPVVALTPNQHVFNQLCLASGVHPVLFDAPASTDETFALIKQVLQAKGYCQVGDKVVICSGNTNLVLPIACGYPPSVSWLKQPLIIKPKGKRNSIFPFGLFRIFIINNAQQCLVRFGVVVSKVLIRVSFG
jgi:hypothetical protein